MKFPVLLAALSVLASIPAGRAETVADRKGAVLKDRAQLENDLRWIYNDYERGFEEARKTGKPLLIVLRCIPCLACSGIDAKILLEKTDLSPLLDKYVCVRVINANTLDLARFQFDFDLSFSTLIFNADGTLYGRYGSWIHQKNPREDASDGFRRALEAGLEIHRGYPANLGMLSGKQPKPTPYKSPLELPSIAGKYTRNLDWEGKVVQSCVHCHQIGDAQRIAYRNKKEKIPPNLINPFPAPETIGLTLAVDRPAHVNTVAPGSAAARAGFQPGDDLILLGGQSLISIADFSWVLHHAPEAAEIPAVVQRNGQRVHLPLILPEGWRSHADSSRRVGTWGMRAMALGGLLLEDLSPEDRARRGLQPHQMALFAKHVGEYGEHAAAKKAGFKKEDVLVEVDGIGERRTETELITHLLGKRSPGETVKVTVLRGPETLTLSLPMQ